MSSAADLKFVLSGGATNADPSASLGGAISISTSGVINSQSVTASTISGVTYDDAAGNTLGNGTVTYTLTGQTLQWTPPGGAIGPAIAVGTSGVYSIYGADSLAHIKLTVVSGSLPVANATQTATIANYANKLFDDISKAEATLGDVEYRCFYVKNSHASESMTAVLLWIDTNASGEDDLAVGLDPIGVGGTATTIATEGTPPTGVTFSAPTSELTALSLGTLATGVYYPVWIRRAVPVGPLSSVPADTSRLKLRFI